MSQSSASRGPTWRRIKASAGSGKTYSLTTAYLALLSGADAQQTSGCARPDADHYAWPEILGITFTNLAAAEMKDRVLARLKEQALSDETVLPGWTRNMAAGAVRHLLRDPGAANIRTIDSLLHAIVRLSALDLGLPPQFESGFDAEAFFSPLLEKQGQKALDEDPALAEDFRLACRLALTGMENGFLAGTRISQGILAALRALEDFSPEQLDGLSPARDLIEARNRALGNFMLVAHDLRVLLDNEPCNFNQRFLGALDKACAPALRFSEIKYDSKYFGAPYNTLKDLCNKNSPDPSELAEAAFAKLGPARERLARLNSLIPAALRLMPFLDLARNLQRSIAEHNREQAVVLGEQMPALAVRALDEGGLGQAYCRLGSRLTHLLVDEFQDTSRLQWRALQPLVAEALSVGGSLTLVGDVKQAIYAWRGGDSDLFDDVMDIPELRDIAPNPSYDSLEHNWRSRRQIIDWNNNFFGLLESESFARNFLEKTLNGTEYQQEMDRAVRLLNRDFQDCYQKAGESADSPRPGGLIRIGQLPPGDADPYLLELLPAKLAELSAHYSLGQICILTRTNKQIELAAQCLLQAGYPVVTEGSLYLAQQALIIQAVALLDWLDAPENDLALWTLLRGRDLLPEDFPLNGDKLEAWAASRMRGTGNLPLGLALLRDFPELWQNWFAPLQEAAGLLTPYDAMREITAKWRVLERNPKDAGFLLRFLEVLHRAEQHGHTDLPSFLDYWRDKGHEEKAPLPPGTEAVSLMTIHKAKGLQFEVVIMPWLDFKLNHDKSPVYWEEDGLRLICEPRACMGDIYFRRKADALREAVNLLYVGWTRAVSELHAWLPQRKTDLDGLPKGLEFLLDQMACRTASGWQTGERTPEMLAGRAPALAEMEAAPPLLGSLTAEVDWKPMAWLPRLRIFRNSLEQLELSPKLRGTILHRCLELLNPGQSGQSELKHLIAQVLRSYSLGHAADMAQDFLDILSWYAGLPDFALWHQAGSPEHSLLDAEGNVFRVDRLVFLPGSYLALEYKSGCPAALPDPDHVCQLGNYLTLLAASSGLPCSGRLIYLDERRLVEIEETRA